MFEGCTKEEAELWENQSDIAYNMHQLMHHHFLLQLFGNHATVNSPPTLSKLGSKEFLFLSKIKGDLWKVLFSNHIQDWGIYDMTTVLHLLKYIPGKFEK